MGNQIDSQNEEDDRVDGGGRIARMSKPKNGGDMMGLGERPLEHGQQMKRNHLRSDNSGRAGILAETEFGVAELLTVDPTREC